MGRAAGKCPVNNVQIVVEDFALSENTAASQWSNVADDWARWAPIRAAMIPATQKMLDLTMVGPGSHVLDVGCGAGEQTVMAAERVGATGHVLATDIAFGMIAATEKAVQAAGYGNVSTRVCGAQELAGGEEQFDAAIARLVLMLVPDPVAAARAVFSLLRPGGAFGAIVHGNPKTNPMNRLATDILARHGGKMVDDEKSPLFKLADPARLIDVMTRAGFTDVAVSAEPAVRRMEDAKMAVTMVRESFAACTGLIADLPPAGKEAAWAELEAAFSHFETADGCNIPVEFNLVVGRKPVR